MGGNDSKPEESKPAPQKKEITMQVEGEKNIFRLNQQIKKFDDMINKTTHQQENLEARVKELISQGKKAEAKRLMPDLKTKKDHIEKLQVRRKVLQTQKNNVQIGTIDAGMVNTMGHANDFMKSVEKNNEKMADILLDQKQIQANMAETNNMMKQLAGNDQQQQVDDLFKELQNDVNRQNAQKIKNQLDKNQPQIKTATVKTNKVTDKQMDQIAMMLNS